MVDDEGGGGFWICEAVGARDWRMEYVRCMMAVVEWFGMVRRCAYSNGVLIESVVVVFQEQLVYECGSAADARGDRHFLKRSRREEHNNSGRRRIELCSGG